MKRSAFIDTLQDSAVRDLAWVIGSPGLLDYSYPAYFGHVVEDAWCNSQLISCAPWLTALDQAPRTLHDFIAARPTRRLGHYFESLIAFWLMHLPDIKIIARNLQVRDPERTLGEYDFLFRDASAAVCHWEAAVKFYLQVEQQIEQRNFIGPGTRDRLDLKLNKVFQHQLLLGNTPYGQQALPQDVTLDKTQAFIKGYLFYHVTTLGKLPIQGISPAHLTGWWMRHAVEKIPQTSLNSCWVILPRMRWLAPARLAENTAVMNATSLNTSLNEHFEKSTEAILLSEVTQENSGLWVEKSRGFVVCSTWPIIEGMTNPSIFTAVSNL